MQGLWNAGDASMRLFARLKESAWIQDWSWLNPPCEIPITFSKFEEAVKYFKILVELNSTLEFGLDFLACDVP